jgi:hypothetical protein
MYRYSKFVRLVHSIDNRDDRQQNVYGRCLNPILLLKITQSNLPESIGYMAISLS